MRTAPSHVDVRVAALPAGLPPGPVDLVVLGEILYYLGDRDLSDTVTRTVAALRHGGHLLAVHWLPWPAEGPVTVWRAIDFSWRTPISNVLGRR